VLALVIKLDSPGPVFFRQQRVGRFGQPFVIHKFRTMVADAPQRGLAITVGADPRITKCGAWLRRTRLDELPQLIDVLRGDMSLVGPRPEVPRYVQHYPPGLRERSGTGSTALLAALRPHREPLSLLVDAAVVAACWNVTYLFRLGFERWISARPGYDGWVLLGIVAAYLVALRRLRCRRACGASPAFGEVKRLTLACLLAGLAGGGGHGPGPRKVPRAVLALHPVVALMGWCWCASPTACVRARARAHRRQRARDPPRHGDGRRRRGAAAAGRHPPAGLGGAGPARRRPRQAGRAHRPACRCWGRWTRCATGVRGTRHPCHRGLPRPRPRSAGARWTWPPAPACRC
jgi:hypothetical protein